MARRERVKSGLYTRIGVYDRVGKCHQVVVIEIVGGVAVYRCYKMLEVKVPSTNASYYLSASHVQMCAVEEEYTLERILRDRKIVGFVDPMTLANVMQRKNDKCVRRYIEGRLESSLWTFFDHRSEIGRLYHNNIPRIKTNVNPTQIGGVQELKLFMWFWMWRGNGSERLEAIKSMEPWKCVNNDEHKRVVNKVLKEIRCAHTLE